MWLALRFVHWALDCRAETQADGASLVVESRAGRQTVHAASPTALAAGIRCGMSLADARIRLESVQTHARRPAAERAAMIRLAGWAWGYSSQIHWAIAAPDVECSRLVLEIGASLRLFGGRRPLLEHIRADLGRLSYRVRAGLGESPQAALAFARADRRMRRHADLACLPIDCLDLETTTGATLAASGLHRAGHLLALPPATLMRRFGRGLLADLERLQGQRPHGLSLYRLPARYDTRHELTGAVENTQGLVFVLQRVFDELAVFLRGADSAIQTLRLALFHEREPVTHITLRLAAPSHDARHLARIAHERLARVALRAPVLSIGLTSDRLRRSEHHQPNLWRAAGAVDRDQWPAVLDRVRARLGQAAVAWVDTMPDHRAERASVSRDNEPPGTHGPASSTGPLPRPIWLLDPPTRLSTTTAAALTWISGPERIESGWWETGHRRDYYRALDASGRLVWVFRDLERLRHGQDDYYLHGLFG